MKNLEDFQAEQIDVKSITGGIGGPAQESGPLWGTMVERATPYNPGCCEQKTDAFNDHDGNGRWDSFPSYGSEPGGDTTPWTLICN